VITVKGKPNLRKTNYGWCVALCDCENEEWITAAFDFAGYLNSLDHDFSVYDPEIIDKILGFRGNEELLSKQQKERKLCQSGDLLV